MKFPRVCRLPDTFMLVVGDSRYVPSIFNPMKWSYRFVPSGRPSGRLLSSSCQTGRALHIGLVTFRAVVRMTGATVGFSTMRTGPKPARGQDVKRIVADGEARIRIGRMAKVAREWL